MKKRKPVTSKQKMQCILWRSVIVCAICDDRIWPTQAIDFDHIWEVSDGGPEEDFLNIRPLHKDCHRVKTTKALKQRAHITRLARGKKPSLRPMKSAKRPWPKRKMSSPKWK